VRREGACVSGTKGPKARQNTFNTCICVANVHGRYSGSKCNTGGAGHVERAPGVARANASARWNYTRVGVTARGPVVTDVRRICSWYDTITMVSCKVLRVEAELATRLIRSRHLPCSAPPSTSCMSWLLNFMTQHYNKSNQTSSTSEAVGSTSRLVLPPATCLQRAALELVHILGYHLPVHHVRQLWRI
jgi:hypothetical protein